jgi:hypothetical protein
MVSGKPVGGVSQEAMASREIQHSRSRSDAAFIVDNSLSIWTGLRYLEEWAKISQSLDIATGYFEVGALTALDGKWQSLQKIRVLIGADTNYRSRNALLHAVREQVERELDAGLEQDKNSSPFLSGVPAILSALSVRPETY